MGALRRALEELYPNRKILFMTGVLSDKDYPSMLGSSFRCPRVRHHYAGQRPRPLSRRAGPVFTAGGGGGSALRERFGRDPDCAGSGAAG